ncbi:dehydratase [bacterium]|nr:MAG: dehydratase [bacterium]
MSSQRVITDGRTVTEADIVQFAGFSGDFMPLHVDEEYARTTPYGTRILHGIATLAICGGLVVRSGVFSGHLGMLGMEYRLTSAVRPGDTIHVELEEISSRVTSSGDKEVAVYEFNAYNQSQVQVLAGKWTQLRPREGTGAGPAATTLAGAGDQEGGTR